MNASQMLAYAKTHNIKGLFIKSFRKGQELREYQIPVNGIMGTFRIRAFSNEHA